MAVTALALMLAAVITWQSARGSNRENALMMTGIPLMGLGASAACMGGTSLMRSNVTVAGAAPEKGVSK